jgi:hypothetical protein
MELIDADKFIAELEKLEYLVQAKVLEDAIEAGMQPVITAMIANSPDSDKTGSRDKQSAEIKRRWSGSRKLKTTIRGVVRKRVKFGQLVGRIGLVGPSYSDGGGHGNLFSKDHETAVYWGKDSRQVRRVDQFVKKTADETRAAASAAVNASLKAGIEAAANRMEK